MHMVNDKLSASAWINNVIKPEEFEKYLDNGKDFIDDDKIWQQINDSVEPSPERVREILAKSFNVQTLDRPNSATS